MTAALLQVEGLSVDFVAEDGPLRAVEAASLVIQRGEVHGLVGESGCGKSTLARALMRGLPPPAVITGGRVLLDGQDVLSLDARALAAVRWRRMALVVQSALDALNPVMRVGPQLLDAREAHGAPAGRAAAVRMLEEVGLPAEVADAWPHQLSGGMRQRVVLAMALGLGPELLILDEPTTALDVVVQAEVLDLLDRLRAARGMGVLLVSHDLPLVLERCTHVSVMYAGRIVESGPVEALRQGPRHPYARHLVESYPRLDGPAQLPVPLRGAPPSLRARPSGCRFHPRCPAALSACAATSPGLETVAPGHACACLLTRQST
jgi:peptide/nickel transport system ATP-binding protein